MAKMEVWVRNRYRALYYDQNGRQCAPYNCEQFLTRLTNERPFSVKAIRSAVKCLDNELYQARIAPEDHSRLVAWVERERDNYLLRKNGSLQDRNTAVSALASLGIYVHPKRLNDIFKGVVKHGAAGSKQVGPQRITTAEAHNVLISSSHNSAVRATPSSSNASNEMSNRQLKEWIYQQYLVQASQPGFTNASFAETLIQMKPDRKNKIEKLVSVFHPQRLQCNLPDLNTLRVAEATELPNNQRLVPNSPPGNKADGERKVFLLQQQSATSSHASVDEPVQNLQNEPLGVSSGEDSSQSTFSRSSSSSSYVPQSSSISSEHTTTPITEIDYAHVHLLQADTSSTEAERNLVSTNEDIKHAPLISADIINSVDDHLLPQVGFLGTHVDSPCSSQNALFLNTNVPFSAVVCGVQGSGKSHTVSCLLENALIPSRHLGRLKTPLSALVFNYGKSGPASKISESAFLTAPHPAFPTHSVVKKITVLTSPSNPAIAKLYSAVPNVRVLPFKLKSRSLNIDTMLTLMAVDDSANPPLYLASVTKILRQMATESSGEFNYLDFKARLKLCQFNPTQLNMLELRLDLLESFLDLNNSCQEPEFAPGEVTIMDMSCPFVDANTACVLFGIGLQNYLQSSASGKMIVLDEAHKYMLDVPGARSLNEDLMRVIRLQRHYGARVVISTQEPVLLTDLIALCSIAVVHRFSSPEWFAALKKHIPMLGQNNDNALQEIESLRTGVALVYSSNAVIGRNEYGDLLRGTSRLLRVNIRKRITADGGQSVLCVR